jgi:stage II sporulation protein D
MHDSHIRVRLNEGASVVRVRGFDLQIYNAGGSRGPVVAADRQSEWELHCEDGRIRANQISGTESIGQKTLDLADPAVIRSPAGFLQYSGKPFREELLIYSVGSLCEVVNEVDLEKYLEGLVNAEFNSRWSEEAIGAQVVAARTYALYQMRQARAEGQHYDIDSSTHDQVYDGSMKEDSRAARIVEKTRGWVLTIHSAKGPEVLKAYYHSNCGGVTELPDQVWGTSNKGFRRVVDPYCHYSPAAHWSFNLSAPQIMNALRLASRNAMTDRSHWPTNWKQLLEKGKLDSLRVGRYDASGRAEQVFLSFNLNQHDYTWEMSGAKFRSWIGPAQFKSTSFQVSLAFYGGSLVWQFSGRGNGHGVGLCQWGAKAMGERGFKTAAILKFYYPDAQLKKFW